MQLNTKKSICIRFGERYKVACSGLASSSGGVIHWNNNCKYLGVYFVSGRVFNCSSDYAKSKYFRCFNAILSKVGRYASECISDFFISKINRIMPFCNLFMERPSYMLRCQCGELGQLNGL